MNKIPTRPRKLLAINKARQTLISLDLKTLPIDPVEVAEALRIGVFSIEELSNVLGCEIIIDSGDADLLLIDGKYNIVYNEKAFKKRIPFTLCHEIGHGVLKHLTDFPQTDINSTEVLSDLEYNILEKEADAFAAELLMPLPVLYDLKPCPDDVCRLCDVSSSAAATRLESMYNSNSCWGYAKDYIQVKELFQQYIDEIALEIQQDDTTRELITRAGVVF